MAPTTSTTIPFSPIVPPLANEAPRTVKSGIPWWIWAILGVSGAANLAVLGAYLNRRYRDV